MIIHLKFFLLASHPDFDGSSMTVCGTRQKYFELQSNTTRIHSVCQEIFLHFSLHYIAGFLPSSFCMTFLRFFTIFYGLILTFIVKSAKLKMYWCLFSAKGDYK